MQHALKNIKDKNIFHENAYQKINPYGSELVSIYGIPKTHKMLFDPDGFSL